MTPIPKPNVRMTPAATPSHPLAAEPAPEGSQIDLPGAREGRFATPHAGTPVVLALGSNLGDRAATLLAAVRSIADIEGFELAEVSPVVESAALKPAGVDHDAPAYLNAVLTGRYAGTPHALLAEINRIEAEHGRERAERWGDRTLDIDIIAFGDLQLSDGDLTIPHPRAAERDFVLAPWLAIDAGAIVPGRGAVAELLAAIGNTVTPFPAARPAGEPAPRPAGEPAGGDARGGTR